MSAGDAVLAVHTVESVLATVQLTEQQATRLRGAIAAAVARQPAQEQLSAHLSQLRGAVSSDWLHTARRLIGEALAEQASEAIAAADKAQLDGSDGYEVAQAVRQALLTDR